MCLLRDFASLKSRWVQKKEKGPRDEHAALTRTANFSLPFDSLLESRKEETPLRAIPSG